MTWGSSDESGSSYGRGDNDHSSGKLNGYYRGHGNNYDDDDEDPARELGSSESEVPEESDEPQESEEVPIPRELEDDATSGVTDNSKNVEVVVGVPEVNEEVEANNQEDPQPAELGDEPPAAPEVIEISSDDGSDAET